MLLKHLLGRMLKQHKEYSIEKVKTVACSICNAKPKEDCIDIYGNKCDIHPPRYFILEEKMNNLLCASPASFLKKKHHSNLKE